MIPRFLRTWLSLRRRTPLARKLAGLCRRFIRWVDNYNYDFATNGEWNILKKLQGTRVETVFDVGANVGDWAVMVRQLFSDAEIHCFEIVPSTAESLRQRLANDNSFIVNPFGLSDGNGNVVVKHYEDAPVLSSLLDYPHPHRSIPVKGKVRCGDAYIRTHSIAHVDLLKIDVEGYEGRVLKGFQRAIIEQRISIIQFEYGTANILAHYLLYDAYGFLTGAGYTIGKIYSRGVEFGEYQFAREDFLGSNYLAVLTKRTDLIRILRP